MDAENLSPKERLHIERGGCLLLVKEIEGSRWELLSISLRGAEIIPARVDSATHDLHRDAMRAAVSLATALGDQALLRPSLYSYEVEFHLADSGMAWRLRMQKDSRDVEEKLFLLPEDADDDELAFYDAHDRALNAGELWVTAGVNG